MKAAIVNMDTEFLDVESNMKAAERYIKNAKRDGAEMIVFPEFFTTGFALDENLISVVMKSGNVKERIRSLCRRHQIIIGGSYLYYDGSKGEIYNEYGLFFSSGEEYFHKKDIPTSIENFCYTYGDDISAFDTPIGRIGIAVCWEMIRWDTVKRMAGRVDMIIAGSCWWNFAKEDGEALYSVLADVNRKMAREAPSKLAEILGVPILHASHACGFDGRSMTDMSVMCHRETESRAMAADGFGKIIYIDDGRAGCHVADINPGCVKKEVSIPEDKYWIFDMPPVLEAGFKKTNEMYRRYYEGAVKSRIERFGTSRG